VQKILSTAVVVVLASLGAGANAAVVDSTPTGFQIEQTVHIAAPPDVVYAALIVPAKWWSSNHTFPAARPICGSKPEAAAASAKAGRTVRCNTPSWSMPSPERLCG
jgi:hypothetical protein